MSSVRRWMKQLEADGDIEAKGTARTGKPGRPPVMYGFTEAGRRRSREQKRTAPQLTDMITRAIHDRKYGDVPYLLRYLALKDPEQARRVVKRLEDLVPPEAR